MSESDIVCEWYSTFRCKDIKGAVHQYCVEVKPFNLTACFIMKCDANIKIKLMKNGGPWKPVYDNVRALVTFFLAYVSID